MVERTMAQVTALRSGAGLNHLVAISAPTGDPKPSSSSFTATLSCLSPGPHRFQY